MYTVLKNFFRTIFIILFNIFWPRDEVNKDIGKVYEEGKSDGYKGMVYKNIKEIEGTCLGMAYIEGFKKGRENRERNMRLFNTELIVIITCLLLFQSASAFRVCGIMERNRCKHFEVELKTDIKVSPLVVCCENRWGRMVTIKGIRVNESRLKDEHIVNCEDEYEGAYKTIETYMRDCFEKRDGGCICLSIASGYASDTDCEIAFPFRHCHEGSCGNLYKYETTDVGCTLIKKEEIYDANLPINVKRIMHSLSCPNGYCVLGNGETKNYKNMSGVILQVVEEKVERSVINYYNVYKTLTLTVIVLIVSWGFLKRVRIEVIRCSTCNFNIVRGIKHSCADNQEKIIEEHIERVRVKQITWVSIVILLTMIVEVSSEVCDRHCFLMNSLKDSSENFILAPYYNGMRYKIRKTMDSYRYDTNTVDWEMESTKANCERFNVRREWTYNYNYDKNSGRCTGKALYGVKGNLELRFQKIKDVTIVGKNCFVLPSNDKLVCLKDNEDYEDESYKCKHKVEQNKTRRLEMEYNYDDGLKCYKVDLKGLSETECNEKGCKYIMEKQPEKFSFDYDPYNDSKLCSKVEVKEKKELRKTNNIVVTKEGEIYEDVNVNAMSELHCETKGERELNCLFTYNINNYNMTEIIPHCKTNYIIEVNETRVVLPCSVTRIPIIARNTRYKICGHDVKTFIAHTTYMCDCNGPITEDISVMVKERIKTEEPLNLMNYVTALYYIISTSVLLWIWANYLINGINVRSIPRDLVDVTLSFHDELDPELRLRKGIEAIQRKQKGVVTNMLMAKINASEKATRAKKSVKTKFRTTLNKIINPKTIVSAEKAHVEAIFDKGMKEEVDYDDVIERIDTSDEETHYSNLKELEGEMKLKVKSERYEVELHTSEAIKRTLQEDSDFDNESDL